MWKPQWAFDPCNRHRTGEFDHRYRPISSVDDTLFQSAPIRTTDPDIIARDRKDLGEWKTCIVRRGAPGHPIAATVLKEMENNEAHAVLKGAHFYCSKICFEDFYFLVLVDLFYRSNEIFYFSLDHL